MRCFAVYVDLTVHIHIECSHRHGVGILVALSVSKFLHAFRATNFLLCEVVLKARCGRINEDTVPCTNITKCFSPTTTVS